jgi:hypothetical protein
MNDEIGGLEAEQNEIFSALSAAAKETGFSTEAPEDADNFSEPADPLVEDTRVSEQDVRDGKIDVDAKAEQHDDEPAEEEAPAEEAKAEAKPEAEEKPADETPAFDWTASGFGEEDAKALSSLSAEKAAQIQRAVTVDTAMQDLLATYSEPYKARGINLTPELVPEYMASLARLDHMAHTDPAGYLRYVAERMNQDPAEVFGLNKAKSPDDDDWDPWADDDEEKPAAKAEAKPAAPEAPKFDPTQPTEVELQARNRAVVTKIESFAQEKGADGQLLRPHFEKVAPSIQAAMAMERQAGRTHDLNNLHKELDRLYLLAVQADPELGPAEYAKIQAANARDQGQAKAREGVERIQKAARASRTASTPAPGARTNGATPSDLPIHELVAGIARGDIQ